ncbi:DUF3379 family protein (plasmid) [Pseudoalteromonas sp. T1lg65]|uniref:DUF3379 family protein n=1 Tax=Pseudoalteromonas sp. T1lg65 TaxID=2077101 RepID=UPI003F7AD79F
MDELEFRRRMYVDPNDPEVIEYALNRPELQAQLQEQQQFNDMLAESINVVVPDGLAEKIIAKQQRLERQHTNAIKQYWFQRFTKPLAIAASILVAVTVVYLNQPLSEFDIGEHALAHVYHEQSSLERQQAIPLQTVNEKLALYGGKLETLPGKLVYATYCNFKGQKSLHLVLQSAAGPVTVFIVPNDHSTPLNEKRLFRDERFDGLVAPGNKASTILVANKNTPIDKFRDDLNRAIHWL